MVLLQDQDKIEYFDSDELKIATKCRFQFCILDNKTDTLLLLSAHTVGTRFDTSFPHVEM